MFRKFLASLLIFIFILVALPATLIWSVYNTFLDRDFYSGEFVGDAYDAMVTVGPELVDLKEFHSLTPEDVRELFQKVFTKDDLAKFFDSTIEYLTSALHDVKGDKIKMKIPLNLLSEKKDIISKEIADLLYEKLPKCGKNAGAGECVPTNVSQVAFEAQIKSSMNKEVFASMPDEFAFDMGVPKEVHGDIGGFITKAFTWFFGAVVLFLLLIMFLLFLIIRKPWFMVLKWEARAILTPSMFMSVFLAILFFSSDIFWKLYNYFASPSSDLALENAVLIKSLLNLVFSSFAKFALAYVLPFLVIGAGLYIAARIYEKKST